MTDRVLNLNYDLNVEKEDDGWVATSHMLGFVFCAPTEDKLYEVIEANLDFFFNTYDDEKGFDAVRKWLDERGVEHSITTLGDKYTRTKSSELVLA